MTPFGLFLENIRRSRQLQQKQLAADLGVQACYISSLEKGRKAPPSKKVLERLIAALDLNEEEQSLMWESVEQSELSFKLPGNMILAEYQLISRLKQQLGRLSQEQITIMLNVLALNTTSNKQTKTRRMNM
ncbi:helix-turn-helix domain-containing protein [Methylobacter tundripaludum]|uniref:Helix-turn-helix domain protein n=2 Tax=Methylobacter tundripaludum TaxID=173365 RepID=G3IWQ8_METTV|nr:helix-turn-helix transcriptional regulator [Methylobacter tundripaludum]EGW23117.1 helix-turn-helix domain protein [Methylobacter tundripaludum SV96]PPK78267.1 helix-turn-helix protein [Methylobacter tundripaludum]